MHNRLNKSKNKHHMKVIAFICAICFIVVFMLSAFILIAHSLHNHESANMCRRTSMPECKCENPIPQVRPMLTMNQYKHPHIDCSICAFVHKTINQIRQLIAANTGIAQLDIDLIVFAALGISMLLSGTNTPVELKTRTNN